MVLLSSGSTQRQGAGVIRESREFDPMVKRNLAPIR
jgi:hypothetical protein